MRPGTVSRSGLLVGIVLLAGLLLSLAASAQVPDPQDRIRDTTMQGEPTTPSGDIIAPIYVKIIWASIAVFVLVAILLGYILIRFRHRKGVKRQVPQIHGNSKLEIAWTIGPALVMIWLLVISYNGLLAIDQPDEEPEVFIEVMASQFLWTFTYTDGTEAGPMLRVQEDTWVQLNVTSMDVIHALAIPGLDIIIDANPGDMNYVQFLAREPGVYLVQCRQFCGTGHGEMLSAVEVFARGSQERPFGAATPAAPPAAPSNGTADNLTADVTFDVAAFDFGFTPAPIGDVEPGQSIKVDFRNDGNAPHNIFVGDYADGSGTPLCTDPADESTCATSETLGKGKTDSFVFTVADEPRFYAVWCNVPGHAQAGMLTYLSVGGVAPAELGTEPRLPGPGIALALAALGAALVVARRFR